MKIFNRFGISALALGLIVSPSVGRGQQPRDAGRGQQTRDADRGQEHREMDLQNIPSPMETVRQAQNIGRMMFMAADVNHDGQISLQEATDANNLLVGGFFFRADADGNGVVTQEEAKTEIDRYLNQNPWLKYAADSLRAEGQKNRQNSNQANPIQGLEALLDTNNDKQIQASELRQIVQTATQTVFAAADTNRDGQMSPSELNAAVAGGARAIAQASFQRADLDNNGQLSREEYDKAIVEPANVAFQILDMNKDGQISPQEAQQVERAVLSQIRMAQMPEPANSPTNLLESGRLPREAAPVPTFAVPNTGAGQNRAQPAPAPAPAPVRPR